jgi:hypothetical protein
MRFTFPFLLILTLPVHAAGPGTENPQAAWDWCMQEAIKAEVWSGDITPQAAVTAAYKACKPEYQTLLATSPDPTKIRSETEADHSAHITFAIKMKKQDRPK